MEFTRVRLDRPARSMVHDGSNERESGMKNWKCTIVAVAVLAFASLSVAQPTIGVYFDEAGTSLDASIEPLPGMATGYVLIKDANMLVGGAAFSIDIDPAITYIFNPLTEQGLYLGNESGLEIGLYNWIPVFDPEDGALLATFSFYSTLPVLNGAISVGAHPNYATPVVANSDAIEFEAEGLTSYLTIHSTPTIGVYFAAPRTSRSPTAVSASSTRPISSSRTPRCWLAAPPSSWCWIR